ncbi:hypothetical protein SLA2020_440760 [Shorea laevis]
METIGDEHVSNLSLDFLLLYIFVVFSFMSMIIFACDDGTNVEEDAAKKKEEESKAKTMWSPLVVVMVAAVVAAEVVAVEAVAIESRNCPTMYNI